MVHRNTDENINDSDASSYLVFGRQLENYGQMFEALQPYKLAKEFKHFEHCHKKSPLTYFLAREVATMVFDKNLMRK